MKYEFEAIREKIVGAWPAAVVKLKAICPGLVSISQPPQISRSDGGALVTASIEIAGRDPVTIKFSIGADGGIWRIGPGTSMSAVCTLDHEELDQQLAHAMIGLAD
jgi:hypothetical protein